MKEKAPFYYVALGSLTEVQNQFLIAIDVGDLNKKTFKQLADMTIEVSKLINGLLRKVKHT